MIDRFSRIVVCAAAAVCLTAPNLAAAQVRSRFADQGTYVDTVELAKKADLVLLARMTRIEPVAGATSGTLSQPLRRYYAQASTRALLYGKSGIGGSLRYLVDLPANLVGSADLMGKDVFLFAARVPGRPQEIRLVEPTALQFWSPERENRLRSVLRALVAPKASTPVTRVRELSFVQGNMAEQGLTQIFLDTEKGLATISVRHEPGRPEAWGVSFSEVAGGPLQRPAGETLEWYNLACHLPPSPPQSAYVSGNFAAKQQAYADYRMVLTALGPCARS